MKHYSEFNQTKYNCYLSKEDGKTVVECDDIITFDIETSSAWIMGDKIIPYLKGKEDFFWADKESISLCYIWQVSVNDEVYYGREIKDFKEFLNKLDKNIKYIIYVHNLSFEFQFLCNIFDKWTAVFAKDKRKVMKCTPEEFPNIEFRCSLFLTRESLENWGNEIGLKKLVGSLDYTVIRTPFTKLTDQEIEYCQRDCEVVYEGIKRYRDKYKHLRNIPLTQTGEVRIELRKTLKTDKKGNNAIMRLIPENAKMYCIMDACFSGGYTHANFMNSNVVFSEKYGNLPLGYGTSYDICSSYPAVMVSEKFPMTPFTARPFSIHDCDKYCFLLLVDFFNVEANTYNHYISYSKCYDVSDDVELDNGRIIKASHFKMWITDVDLDIIMKTYSFDCEISESYASRKSYLPKSIIKKVLEYYCGKTKYKGVKGKENEYITSKKRVNSIFGCQVQKLVQDTITYKDGEWVCSAASIDDINKKLDLLRKNGYGKVYTAFQWGIFISAYGRRNLWDLILYNESKDKSVDYDLIYCDTDSLKLCDEYNFDWYNERVKNKMIEMCSTLDIDYSLTCPCSPDGKQRPLGYLVKEDDWTEFKTLGAKRYCYRSKKDNKLHITIAGINKEAVEVLNDNIENFNDELVFDKDADCVKKKAIIYNDNQSETIWNKGKYDEYKNNDKFGIVLKPVGYSMSIEDEYASLLSQLH